MVSEGNLQAMQEAGFPYIMATCFRGTSGWPKEVLTQPGGEGNPKVKGVKLRGAEAPYIVCLNRWGRRRSERTGTGSGPIPRGRLPRGTRGVFSGEQRGGTSGRRAGSKRWTRRRRSRTLVTMSSGSCGRTPSLPRAKWFVARRACGKSNRRSAP